MMLVFSLKIGTNDCSIFKLNDGFRSFRTGFQHVPAKNGQNLFLQSSQGQKKSEVRVLAAVNKPDVLGKKRYM